MTDVVTAEVIKYASNAFLATKISYINEMADLCEAVGADVHVRGERHGARPPDRPKFLHPGPATAVRASPRTPGRSSSWRDHGVDLRIVRSVIEVNDARRRRMIEKDQGGARRARRATICLLGLTFKPNTDDLRESPAMAIMDGC